MTAADVKFSFDDARAQAQGWGYLDVGDQECPGAQPVDGRLQPQVPVGAVPFHHRLLRERDHPQELRRPEAGRVLQAPDRHRPYSCGTSGWSATPVSFKRNPYYWQKGKPYLDRVTWNYVSDQNTRELQLRGGQIEINEFPPFSSIKKLQNTSGVKMLLFPSTRTDYLLMNEAYAPLKDVHVRRAISYSVDRAAIAQGALLRLRKGRQLLHAAAGALLRPEVAGHPVQPEQGEGRDGQVEVQERLHGRDARRRRRGRTSNKIAQVIQQALKEIKINVKFRQVDTSTEFSQLQEGKYQLGFSYWTMDIADPDELVTFAVDPKGGGANSFFTGYKNPKDHRAHAPGATRDGTLRSDGASTRRSSGSPHRTRSWGSSSTRRSAGPRPRK